MIERLDIKTAASILGCSIRTLNRWCIKFGVRILQDEGFRGRFVIKKEFENAMNITTGEYLNRKYGSSSDEIASRIKLESQVNIAKNKRDNSLPSQSFYTPEQKHELNFLSRLTNTINKINNTK